MSSSLAMKTSPPSFLLCNSSAASPSFDSQPHRHSICDHKLLLRHKFTLVAFRSRRRFSLHVKEESSSNNGDLSSFQYV
ncbi:hypothetical protein F2Q69_00027224 [Brassica cretica]|uniref:Uncharacterized protein n=1 Tax=Brassica cretica TaxID=69181 RepID=A0A8S9RXK9_BRACR|nr:hypothetical protein F2Q69_00027224 [Brassica cretica]